MHFFCFSVSIARVCASVFLFYSIRSLLLTVLLQISNYACTTKTGVPKWERRSGSGSVYARLAQKPSNIVAIWSRVALPCGASKT